MPTHSGGTMNNLSHRIKSLSEPQLIEFLQTITNENFLHTLVLVDKEAQDKIFSVVSEETKERLEHDLNQLESELKSHWN